MRHPTLRVGLLCCLLAFVALPAQAQGRPLRNTLLDNRHGNRDRLRGVNVPTSLTQSDLDTLGTWRPNVVRYQLNWTDANARPATLSAYNAWLNGQLAQLDQLLPVFAAKGELVVVDLHTAPGGTDPVTGQHRLFRSLLYQNALTNWWVSIAKRYKSQTIVWGYDLVNEPVQGTVASGCQNWHDLATRVALAIRKQDPSHAIIVEPNDYALPENIWNLAPLTGIGGVVYSVHMYEPEALTAQGIMSFPIGPTYPGVIDGAYWDKTAIANALQPCADYSYLYSVPIYVGEFSCIRWAAGNSAYNWLSDAISVMETDGFDWTYHIYREPWNGWSVEWDTGQPGTNVGVTDRLLLLQNEFALNQF